MIGASAKYTRPNNKSRQDAETVAAVAYPCKAGEGEDCSNLVTTDAGRRSELLLWGVKPTSTLMMPRGALPTL